MSKPKPRAQIKRAPEISDTSDEDQVKQMEDHVKDLQRDLEWIVSTPRGRRWMYTLIYGKAHKRALSHVPRDTHSTAFNEGARSVGEALLEELRAQNHAAFITMLEENDNAE